MSTYCVRIVSAVTVLMIGCERSTPSAVTVPGPESADLVPTVTGYVVFGERSGAITAIHLPTLKESTIRPEGPAEAGDVASIHALSGPDAEGRIAYIEDHFFAADQKNQRHLLKTIDIDGSEDSVLFSRPGNALWAATPAGRGEIGQSLAISPTNGQVALVSGLVPVQMPSAYLHVGNVEVWDLGTKSGRKAIRQAIDAGLGWFPNGKRLAFVKLVQPASIPGYDEGMDSASGTFQGWDRIPCVFVFDRERGTETFLHVGWRPVVSRDGLSVLVADFDLKLRLVTAATGQSTPVTWPGVVGSGGIAMPDEKVVLSWCYPTIGSQVKYTEHNSPMVGPKQMLALKLAKMNSDKFQSVVTSIDPRTLVSFGRVSEALER